MKHDGMGTRRYGYIRNYSFFFSMARQKKNLNFLIIFKNFIFITLVYSLFHLQDANATVKTWSLGEGGRESRRIKGIRSRAVTVSTGVEGTRDTQSYTR